MRKAHFFTLLILLLCRVQLHAQDTIYSRATVAIIPPAMVSPFHVALADGAKAEGDLFGWEVLSRAPERETDFEGQVTIIEQLVYQGIDAISVSPINFSAVSVGVATANEAHVPIFMHNTITLMSEGDVAGYIGYDQWGGAALLANYVCQLLAGDAEPGTAQGEVYILTGIPGFHTNRRTGGFEYGLSQNCPNVLVIGSQSAEWEREKGLQVATAALQQYPDIDVFYGNSDEMAIGACLAASQLGRNINEDIYCVGIDGNPVTLDAIKNNEMTATLGVYPGRMGAVVIDQMNRYLIGEAIPQILLTPSIVVDKDNVDAYLSGETWTEPVAGSPETDNNMPTILEVTEEAP